MRQSQSCTPKHTLPAHLPSIERVIDLDYRTCPYCQGDLHVIGEDVTERLDIMPA